jgi:arginyl-tRNA synthetase
MVNFQVEIEKIFKKHTSVAVSIEIPPDASMGDYAVPCFPLAKELKKAPPKIASDLAQEMSKGLDANVFEKVVAVGPYVNFFTNKVTQVKGILGSLHKLKANYGKAKLGKQIMIEFSSPNTNKPLHLGHIRNILLGESVSRIHAFAGNAVTRSCVVNDRGVHICKSMLAYMKKGEGATPKSADMKGDFFVGKWYIEFSKMLETDTTLEEEAHELLRKWEKGDAKVVALWKKMNKWVYEGFDETYAQLGIVFDKTYYESSLYKEGKEIVMKGLQKKVFVKDEGAIVVDLEDQKMGKKVLIRSDGTALYMTQDLYLAVKKFGDFKLDRSVYVVGSEQELHFRQLFAILKVLGYSWADGCKHLSYGMVYLPEGKMKSREGKVVDADDLISEMVELAAYQIKLRHKDIADAELKDRSFKVGMAALKFFILRTDLYKDMLYNPKESISFEGETGPYVQYTYARIQSILRKFDGKVTEKIDYTVFDASEVEIVKHIGLFGAVVKDAASHYKPSLICRWLLELCQMYNEFYHANPILQEKEDLKMARLLLSKDVALVIKQGLALLGIDVVDVM